MEQSKRQGTEFLVMAERQQHQYDFQEGDFSVIRNDSPMHSSPRDASQRSYGQVIQKQREQVLQNNIEYTLSSFLNKIER